MIKVIHKGNFEKSLLFFDRLLNLRIHHILEKYGREGVAALSSQTPKDTGLTAASWDFEIEKKSGTYSIFWKNTNVNDGVNIAVILQYGHGTGTGGYVVGRDYINPAMRSIFDKIANAAWREVSKL